MIRSSADTVASHDVREAIDDLLWAQGEYCESENAPLWKSLRMAVDALRASAWQEIESAPKDGTLILVTAPQWLAPEFARWERNGWKNPTLHMKPTHWMPLPDPPQIGSGNQAAPEHSVATDRSAAQKS